MHACGVAYVTCIGVVVAITCWHVCIVAVFVVVAVVVVVVVYDVDAAVVVIMLHCLWYCRSCLDASLLMFALVLLL